jgi:raffinose/stachyose/melibiose transport system substrate-binding protein
MIISARPSRRVMVGLLALATALTTATSGCGGSSDDSNNNGKVKLTWWHNANNDPGLSFWSKIAKEYEAKNSKVTIEVVPMQNEQFTTKLPVALQSSNPPDIFQQWGGGQLADQVSSGRVMDITADTKSWIDQLGTAAENWKVDGKQYGIPYSLGVVGFWYNKELFTKAGITATPTSWDDFVAAINKLKAAGIAPIGLGGKDQWPDAFYWDFMAVRLCSQQTLKTAIAKYKFDDQCFVQAGQKVKDLIGVDPFQKGFLATPAQQGATSSAGLLANGKVAMELQGHWNPGVLQGLTPDQKPMGDKLGWFPFPAISGGSGDANAALGGGDGFSCSYKAPKECVDFLKYISSLDVQTRWAGIGAGLPVTKGAESGVSDTNLKSLVDYRGKASYVQLYFDVALLTSVGKALNEAIAKQFAGEATPEQVVKALTDAAKNR